MPFGPDDCNGPSGYMFRQNPLHSSGGVRVRQISTHIVFNNVMRDVMRTVYFDDQQHS
jgi:hypothetical protein